MFVEGRPDLEYFGMGVDPPETTYEFVGTVATANHFHSDELWAGFDKNANDELDSLGRPLPFVAVFEDEIVALVEEFLWRRRRARWLGRLIPSLDPPWLNDGEPAPNARFIAGHLESSPLPHARYDHSVSTSPPSAEVTREPDNTDRILEDLRALATWPRLRDATLPDPIVGGLESDPAGIADLLGARGSSVYTAFIEMDSLRCRACGHQSSEMTLAILHQRHRRHFQQ
jgi:hypothetical protein